MEFFFPDAQDLIDPSFDFRSETRADFRVRQRDDLYAHEAFKKPPFDGILVSKAIVDGSGTSGGKYTLAQRHRLLRLGIREFLRVDRNPDSKPLRIMGDCGAFTYKDAERPPFSVEDVIRFYEECRFDLGISVDHVILGFNAAWDTRSPRIGRVPRELKDRQRLTLSLAKEFLDLCKSQRVGFSALGVAQGWSPNSYARAVDELQRMGYDYIAVGGMVPLRTSEILSILATIDNVRRPRTRLHLLGVTRVHELWNFAGYGVVSFDSTSPFLQAFKDDKDNYHTAERTYSAIRVPQVEGSPNMERLVRAGRVRQGDARRLEQLCLEQLHRYDSGEVELEDVLGPLQDYEQLHSQRTRIERYKEVLADRPWKDCVCEICRSIGIDVVVFRGSERNKRRGFHNLAVFRQKLSREIRGD